MNEINFYSRKDEYGWLSNFWRQVEKVDNKYYSTNEHYYQACKSKDVEIFHWILSAPNPYLAMCAGRSLRKDKELINGWEKDKIKVMLKGLRAKFENLELRKRLLDTGDAILHEDSPTDMFWGKYGKDMLGKLLMQVREELKEEERLK